MGIFSLAVLPNMLKYLEASMPILGRNTTIFFFVIFSPAFICELEKIDLLNFIDSFSDFFINFFGLPRQLKYIFDTINSSAYFLKNIQFGNLYNQN